MTTTQRAGPLCLMFYYDGQFPMNIPWLMYYPAGVLYRVPFRYPLRYVSPSAMIEQLRQLSEALIVMKFSSLEQSGNQQYIPIRKVTITRCEEFVDQWYVYMLLGEFVEYSDAPLSQFSERFRTAFEGGRTGAFW
jgi:hypothetical protein